MKLVSYVSAALLATVPFSVMANETDVASDVVVSDDVVAVEEINEKSPWYSGIEFGVGVSATSGLNGFVGYANKDSDCWLMRRLGLRLDFASTKPIRSSIDSAVDSIVGDKGFEVEEFTINNFDIDAKHIGAIVDFYPFGDTWALGGWRISGGYVTGNLNVSADLTGDIDGLPSGGFTFSYDGVDYKYTGNDARGTAQIDWDYSGPYIGTGFDIGLFAGLKIYIDAGVVFTNNSAKISAEIPQDNLFKSVDGGNTWSAVAFDEVEAEKQKALADAQGELDKLDFYPMVKVGFMYRF